MVKLTVIMDNLASENKSLHNCHGLSLFIESSDLNLMFDFGSGEDTIKNFKALNIDINNIDYAICSHSHYDHAGGYKNFVRDGLKSPLIVGDSFFNKKLAFNGIKYTDLGANFNSKFLSDNNIKLIKCDDILKLSDECFVVGNFDRVDRTERIPDRFVCGDLINNYKDSFNDEIVLVVKSDKGLIIIVGCSHPGIVNITRSISKRFNESVYGIIGGTHLIEADEDRINYTLEELMSLGVEFLAFNHCSGMKVVDMISKNNKFKSCYLAAGDCIYFS
ncbi:Metallo-beta-lactamase superfamily [uncultured Clostridium sp.]|uniref:MBL fold metallo-hydrolase n=1 Tax=uncultured Clostridium sp. TaxID=59620 RepID=UPI00082100B3|nr:MBL fold metallo-hydrolase [uncultured Clostridium sp.]SCJ99890.1 Metallo-beta-lactamase superfamily [uncultured Clostridium sp.]